MLEASLVYWAKVGVYIAASPLGLSLFPPTLSHVRSDFYLLFLRTLRENKRLRSFIVPVTILMLMNVLLQYAVLDNKLSQVVCVCVCWGKGIEGEIENMNG